MKKLLFLTTVFTVTTKTIIRGLLTFSVLILLGFYSIVFATDDPKLSSKQTKIKTTITKRNVSDKEYIDPILLSMSANKLRVTNEEEVEIIITARYLDLHPSNSFTIDGSNGFTLRLLVPENFKVTGGSFSNDLRCQLSNQKPEAVFNVKGYFQNLQSAQSSTFRLLRGSLEANQQSIFVEKAKCIFEILSVDNSLRIVGIQQNSIKRHIIWNVFGASRLTVSDLKNRGITENVTGINFWVKWADIQNSPTSWGPGIDSLLSAIQYCKELGLKAEVDVYLFRKYDIQSSQQDYSLFFPESDICRYQDGSYYEYEPILGRYFVLPSFSSQAGQQAIGNFFKGLSQRLKGYYDDGTLLNLQFATGNAGEFTYPSDGENKISDFSVTSLIDFRCWLQEKYQTINLLNTNWNTNYTSFSSIDWSIIPNPPFSIDNNSKRDWQRWRINRLRSLADKIVSSVKSEANIPVVAILSELGGGFVHNIAFAATNVAYICANLDGVYSSGGSSSYDLEKSKLVVPDLTFGTLGSDKITAIEFDGDDLSEPRTSGNMSASDQFYYIGRRFFDKGGQIIHITTASNLQYSPLAPYMAQLKTEYCSLANNTPTARNPQTNATYNYSTMLSSDESAHWTAWYQVQGNTRQVDLRQIDDFVVNNIPFCGSSSSLSITNQVNLQNVPNSGGTGSFTINSNVSWSISGCLPRLGPV